MKYYSQIGQDQYYIENIINFKKNGIFIDIGANNGIHASNTATLEFDLGWTGVCIEANPNLIESLTKNRPNSKICNYAAWNKDTTLELEISNSNRNNIEGHLLSRISGLERNKDYFKKHFKESRELLKVQAKPLTGILKDINFSPSTIDYLSIDTEGAEIETLQGINFNQLCVKFITIEHGNRSGYIEEFEKILIPNNFKIHRINEWDVEFENLKGKL